MATTPINKRSDISFKTDNNNKRSGQQGVATCRPSYHRMPYSLVCALFSILWDSSFHLYMLFFFFFIQSPVAARIIIIKKIEINERSDIKSYK